MARKSKPQVLKADLVKDLWINPRSNIRGPDGNHAWDNRTIPPNSGARFLELADIALGIKKPAAKKKKAVVIDTHQMSSKTEPYSS